MRYSPSTRGFYPEDLEYATLPDDLVDIDDAYHAQLIAAQETGKEIVPDRDGVPVLADPPPPDIAAVRALMTLTRQQLLTGLMLDGLIAPSEALAAARDGEVPAAVETIMAAMPEPQQTAARIKFASFTVAHRTDAMVALFAAAATPPLSDTDVDDFFTRHAAL